MKVAVEGCAHGELDKIYEALDALQQQNDVKVDLLIICGDFQAVRNPTDLMCMAVPPKYRKLNTFYKYYSGEKVAPVLTIFVGGNHEASNYLSELTYGGWVCPNIYYMGYANVINVGGIRIAGLSGIYKGGDYTKGHFEHPPYNDSTKKSVYHVRNVDVFRLKQVKKPIDICISHDWPRGVYNFGNVNKLLKQKRFFREEVETNRLGSQPAEELLEKLKPSFWFAAHLHCKFASVVPHDDKDRPFTKFLALDKCLPRRNFLQILEIENSCDPTIMEYDDEWLAILKTTNHLLNVTRRVTYMPGIGSDERWDFSTTDEEISDVRKLFEENLKIPSNFTVTAPTYNPSEPKSKDNTAQVYPNPQTQLFCCKLGVTNPYATPKNFDHVLGMNDVTSTEDDSFNWSKNPDETSLSDEDDTDNISSSFPGTDFSDSGDFFIDTHGTHKPSKASLESCDGDDFFIDKNGSHGSVIREISFSTKRIPNISSAETIDSFLEVHDAEKETKEPSRLSSNAETFIKTQFCSTPIQEIKLKEDFPELKVESDNVEAEKESTPISKKFKRRNFALYGSEDISSSGSVIPEISFSTKSIPNPSSAETIDSFLEVHDAKEETKEPSHLSSNTETFIETQFSSTPIQEIKLKENFPELKVESDNVEAEKESTPIAKKFKRRNFALYGSEETP